MKGKAKSRRNSGARRAALDRYDCYELCVQDGDRMARFLAAVHGGGPRILREDFSGSGAVCRAWSRIVRSGRAIAVDRDAEPLRRLARVRSVTTIRSDVLKCRRRADVISATNFSIGYLHTRRDLLRYLRQTRSLLNVRGVFVCDTYGGSTAFTRGTLVRDHFTPDGIRVRHTWEQREADPLTGMVTDVIHFRGDRDGEVLFDYPEAFVYSWRLWSIAELREAMADAGYQRTDVYHELGDAIDTDGNLYCTPVTDPAELPESFVVCIAARM